MATAVADDELQLKKRARRRLVGAIALVMVVVIFLPMFLADEPQPRKQDIAINIPALPAVESPAAVPPAPSAPAEALEVPKPVELDRTALAETAEPAQSTAKPAVTAPPAPPKPVSPAKVEAGGDYMVQLGAFSNSGNAKALQKKLQDNKFKAHTELVKAPGGDRTRVRVGPYPSREAAEKARDRLKSLKLVIGDASVVRQGD